ncbi:MAG: TRAP transporter substrate-binding protein DctP [Rhodospirillum sp.]|nr:TRAP transporter substrate-binding protein DctP [Rhodospirillum sp.]MCF8487672.1 TRAP transporter substrate-binding protein DctP [Rhodospirillum sp.]MCF8500417.1 TRAP transporter substrate-binding protein DctP [Rhodospirillum sp.]
MNMFTKTLLGAVSLSVLAAPAFAAEKWTMTSTWTSSLALIEFDKHWVELVNKLAGDELQIDFFEGGTLVPSGEVFGAVQSGDIQAGADWPGYWAGRSPAFSPLATHTSLFNAVDYMNWITAWGGEDLYKKVYGAFGMVYIPYAVTSDESGFRTQTPIKTKEDLKGKRLRLSGLDQGKVLERLGGNQVSMAGQEIYQAMERGVIDGAEFSTPNVDLTAGFDQVSKAWSTPGWHQSASVFGVMINKAAYDALSDETKEKLEIAAQATMTWGLATFEKLSSQATRDFAAKGIEITRMDDATLAEIQQVSNEVITESACADPLTAEVYASQLAYLADYKDWRAASQPFGLGRNPNGPDLAKIQECADKK